MGENRLAVGIDFSSRVVRVGLVYQGHVIDRLPELATAEFKTAMDLIDAMAASVATLQEAHPGVSALGAGVPGFVDFGRGLVYRLPKLDGWESIPLRRILEERTGLQTVVENRANCMAEAEWKYGAARGLRDMVFINLGSGVGGAVIANGNLVRGARFGAGEIGQTSIHWQGRRGKFGNAGAFEKYLGMSEIEEDTHNAYTAAGVNKAKDECSVAALASAAHAGDPVALARWEEIGAQLAIAVMNCCWLLNPEAVIIGGAITRIGDPLFTPLRDNLLRQLSDPFMDHLLVIPAKCGADGGVIGSAALALEGRKVAV